MTNPKNLFIALEGIDGSGKTTQARLLSENLQKAGHKVYTTFEPTDSFIGSTIRDILKGNKDADHRTIAGLFVADRLHHLLNNSDGLLKKLQEGFTVVTDRYYFSSYAYHGTHMDLDWVIQANAQSAALLRPDLNVFIDVSPAVAMQRINANREKAELYETLENLEKVKFKYFKSFEKERTLEKIFITNGDCGVEEIATSIFAKVQKQCSGTAQV